MPGAELSGRREPEAPWGFLLSSGDKDLGFHKGIHRAIDAWGGWIGWGRSGASARRPSQLWQAGVVYQG